MTEFSAEAMTRARQILKKVIPPGVRRRGRRLVHASDIRLRVMALDTLNRLSRRGLDATGDGVVVSLTTYPPRLSTVHLVIESVFHQKLAPSGVFLWVFEGEISESELPVQLQRLRNRGLQIEFVPENLRGAKKLVYAVERFPDKTIVTADDDLIYPSDWLSSLLEAYRETPDTVICHRGHYLRLKDNAELHPYRECMKPVIGGTHPSYNLLPTGGAGALYPPGSLDARVMDTSLLMRLCPTADDVWFKAMTMLQGVMARRVKADNMRLLKIPGTQDEKLYTTNRDMNDQQLADTFEYFNLYPLLRK